MENMREGIDAVLLIWSILGFLSVVLVFVMLPYLVEKDHRKAREVLRRRCHICLTIDPTPDRLVIVPETESFRYVYHPDCLDVLYTGQDTPEAQRAMAIGKYLLERDRERQQRANEIKHVRQALDNLQPSDPLRELETHLEDLDLVYAKRQQQLRKLRDA